MVTKSHKYAAFVVFNWLLICGCIYLLTPGKKYLFEPILLSMYLVALVLIIAQYPVLVAATLWRTKILVFYASMVLFLAFSPELTVPSFRSIGGKPFLTRRCSGSATPTAELIR